VWHQVISSIGAVKSYASGNRIYLFVIYLAFIGKTSGYIFRQNYSKTTFFVDNHFWRGHKNTLSTLLLLIKYSTLESSLLVICFVRSEDHSGGSAAQLYFVVFLQFAGAVGLGPDSENSEVVATFTVLLPW